MIPMATTVHTSVWQPQQAFFIYIQLYQLFGPFDSFCHYNLQVVENNLVYDVRIAELEKNLTDLSSFKWFASAEFTDTFSGSETLDFKIWLANFALLLENQAISDRDLLSIFQQRVRHSKVKFKERFILDSRLMRQWLENAICETFEFCLDYVINMICEDIVDRLDECDSTSSDEFDEVYEVIVGYFAEERNKKQVIVEIAFKGLHQTIINTASTLNYIFQFANYENE